MGKREMVEVEGLQRELFDGLLEELLALMGKRVRVGDLEGWATRAVVAEDHGMRAVVVLLDDDLDKSVAFAEVLLVDLWWDLTDVEQLVVTDSVRVRAFEVL